MTNQEGSPWTITSKFLAAHGVRVQSHPKGMIQFNTLHCEATKDKISLSREVKANSVIRSPDMRFLLVFEEELVDRDLVVAAICKLEGAEEAELEDLAKHVGSYFGYEPSGIRRISRIVQVQLIGPTTLTIVPFGTPQKPPEIKMATLGFDRGTLSVSRNLGSQDPARRAVNVKL